MRRVNPRVYTEKYYLSDCTGFEHWKRSGGKEFEPRFERIVKEMPPVRNLRILDIGCGRGELALWCARNGAKLVIGIDYSKDAIKLANQAKKHFKKDIQKKVTFKLGNGKKLEFEKNNFDAVLLTEVLEHVYPEEQVIIFNEIKRVLRDDGFVFVHTAPSKWFNDYTYKLWCYPISTLLIKINKIFTGKNYGNLIKPSELRNKYHKIMHVNEPDYFAVKRLYKLSGFKGEIRSTNITISKPNFGWKDKLFNSIVYINPLSNCFPINILFGNDFYSILRKR